MLELISCFEMRVKKENGVPTVPHPTESRNTREALIHQERTLSSPNVGIKTR